MNERTLRSKPRPGRRPPLCQFGDTPARGERGEISPRLWTVTKFYLDHKKWGILRRFAKTDIATIQTKHYHQYLDWVQEQDASLRPATLNHIASVFAKVMKLARQEGIIDFIPAMPRVKRQDNPRSFFRFYPLVDRKYDEYQLLLTTAKTMAEEKVRVRVSNTMPAAVSVYN
jgi:hypothetical protein